MRLQTIHIAPSNEQQMTSLHLQIQLVRTPATFLDENCSTRIGMNGGTQQSRVHTSANIYSRIEIAESAFPKTSSCRDVMVAVRFTKAARTGDNSPPL